MGWGFPKESRIRDDKNLAMFVAFNPLTCVPFCFPRLFAFLGQKHCGLPKSRFEKSSSNDEYKSSNYDALHFAKNELPCLVSVAIKTIFRTFIYRFTLKTII